MNFRQETWRDLDGALGREWLETNGLGGFASSTIVGVNTRRYHGLLVAATKPPVGRLVLLAKLEETLIVNGQRYELSANEYADVIHPRGYEYLKEFRRDPFPVFVYEVAGIKVEKTVFMPHGANSTVIQYAARVINNEAMPELRLEVRPLIACRDYHATTHENAALDAQVEAEAGQAAVRPYTELPPLYFAHDADGLEATGYWYRNFAYRAERERGLDFQEDLFNPFVWQFDLRQRAQASIIAATERCDVNQVAALKQAELTRRQSLAAHYPQADELVRTLLTAADQFIVARGAEQTVIAGYHWFSDWGRDTMIALPGLTLVTGRYNAARSILLTFAAHVDQGMLPNRFPDAGEQPEYNTVDAALWYCEAVRALLQYTGDYQFVRAHLYPVLTEIIDWHERGTRYGIRVDEDGLLAAGAPGVQLTWMDAKVGDWVVTPRHGKAVEIQALWYNALRVMEHLAQAFDDVAKAQRYGRMATRAAQSFNQQFWNEAAGCLYDVVDGEKRDGAMRPNQIFAVSLAHSMLARERAEQVVNVVARDLLTPYGLRSLAPHEAQYCGKYEGGPAQRDAVYHQGTVWAWLMGPFITAYCKVHDHEQGRQQAAHWLAGFNAHLREAGLGQVAEIFDGDAPHQARGCIAQAWSVAELLRAATENGFTLSPLHSQAARH